jgi:hypothetical protein
VANFLVLFGARAPFVVVIVPAGTAIPADPGAW